MPDRPEVNKTGQVSINVFDSVITTIDAVFDAFGLPEPGSIIYRITPDNVADALGFPTPDDITDDWLGNFDRQLGVNQPVDR